MDFVGFRGTKFTNFGRQCFCFDIYCPQMDSTDLLQQSWICWRKNNNISQSWTQGWIQGLEETKTNEGNVQFGENM